MYRKFTADSYMWGSLTLAPMSQYFIMAKVFVKTAKKKMQFSYVSFVGCCF